MARTSTSVQTWALGPFHTATQAKGPIFPVIFECVVDYYTCNLQDFCECSIQNTKCMNVSVLMSSSRV